jgi:hypothetical protein
LACCRSDRANRHAASGKVATLPAMTRFFLAALTLLLLALAVVACGGGGDAPSKADFAKEVEKICNDTKRQLRDIGGNGAATRDEVADAVDKVIEKSQKSVDDMKGLELPEGDARATAEKFVDATESEVEDKGIPALEDLRDALKANDQRAMHRAVKKLQSIESSDSTKYARQLGAVGCAG